MALAAERVVDSGDRLGECPIWDERMAALWWVDIHGRSLRRYDGELKSFPLPEQAGSIALRREGGLLVALESGVFLLGTEAPRLLVRPAAHAAGLRFNDGRATAVRETIRVPNSLAWSPDGRTMYFADSPRHKIWAFD